MLQFSILYDPPPDSITWNLPSSFKMRLPQCIIEAA